MTQQIQKKETNVLEGVIKRVNQLQELGELKLPKDYAAENAARAAWLVLQEQKTSGGKLVVQVATKDSIANAMFKMLISGLSVVKKQGDFILYGDKLNWQNEYHGNKNLAKRFGNVKDASHNTIYENDVFEYTIDKYGKKQILKHEQKMQNIDMNKIVGAYAIVTYNDDTTQAEIMNIQQIRQSWMQGATKGQSPAHKNFPDRMAEKTVANRLLTSIINASDDSGLFSGDEPTRETKSQTPDTQNKKVQEVSFDDAEIVDEPEQEEPQQEPEPTPEPEKKESKVETPSEPKKASKSSETLFDDDQQPF